MLKWLRSLLPARPTPKIDATYLPMPPERPEDVPEFARLQALHNVSADRSEWRDIDQRLAEAASIEPFDTVWKTYVALFARTYRDYLPDAPSVAATMTPQWWVGDQSPSRVARVSSSFTVGPPPDARLKRAFVPLINECLGLVEAAERHLERLDAARASAAMMALDLRSYLSDEYLLRQEVAQGRWGLSLVSAVADYRQAFHDMMQAESRLTNLMRVWTQNYEKEARAGVYHAELTQAIVAGSPMFSNSGSPININANGIDKPATWHLSAAAAVTGPWNWQMEIHTQKRDFQAASYTLRKQRDLVDAAHAKVKYTDADIEVQRAAHQRSVRSAASKILLACQEGGALNHPEQAQRHSQALRSTVLELAARLVAARDGISETLGTNTKVDDPLANLLAGKEVIVGDALAAARQYLLSTASELLQRRKIGEVRTLAVSLRAQATKAWRTDVPLAFSFADPEIGTGVNARILACECLLDDDVHDFWPVSISPPGTGTFLHSDGRRTEVDQTDLADTHRSLPSGPLFSLDPTRSALEEMQNLAPAGQWSMRVGTSAKGREPNDLTDIFVRLQIILDR